MKIILFGYMLSTLSTFICAQNIPGNDAKIKVFLDCKDFFCDWDFIIAEIPMVDYVRDQNQADVHVVIIRQQTASGGYVYHIDFIQRDSAGTRLLYNLKINTTSSTTKEELQKMAVRSLSTGLLPLIAQTNTAGSYSLTFQKESVSETKSIIDQWDHWVFTTSANANMSGEQSVSFFSSRFSLSANRVTADWKILLNSNVNYYEEKFHYESSSTTTIETKNVRRNYYVNTSLISTLSDHWSAGGWISGQQDLFQNIQVSSSVYSGVEYNLFPYSESPKHQVRINYRIGGNYQQYVDTTVYLKLKETLGKHRFSINASFVLPWGSIVSEIAGSQYFYDLKKNNLNFFNNINIRLFEGLSLSLFGYYEAIHDQLSLRKDVATIETVLRQQQQLETSYSYYFSVGLSYTFGSIYNNVVNVRFGD